VCATCPSLQHRLAGAAPTRGLNVVGRDDLRRGHVHVADAGGRGLRPRRFSRLRVDHPIVVLMSRLCRSGRDTRFRVLLGCGTPKLAPSVRTYVDSAPARRRSAKTFILRQTGGTRLRQRRQQCAEGLRARAAAPFWNQCS